jgi:hypothetical protein
MPTTHCFVWTSPGAALPSELHEARDALRDWEQARQWLGSVSGPGPAIPEPVRELEVRAQGIATHLASRLERFTNLPASGDLARLSGATAELNALLRRAMTLAVGGSALRVAAAE